MPPISNEVNVQNFVPKKEVKDNSPSLRTRDSLEAVTSALKANEEAFKGQLPKSLREVGGDIALVVDEGDEREQEEEEEEMSVGGRPLRLLQDPFEEPRLSGRRRPTVTSEKPSAITGES